MRNLSLPIILLVVFCMITYSCNEDKKNYDSINLNLKSDNTLADSTVKTTIRLEQKKWPENYLVIEAYDLMQYNLNELKAKAGKPIILVLKNVGKSNKIDMGHNLVILKEGTNLDNFTKKALSEKDNGYISSSESKSIIAHTKLLGCGETDPITFTIKQKGKYDYLCSFLSHSFLMKGKLIIE